MAEPIWDGRLNPSNDLRRAEGENVPPNSAELRKIVTEIIATQKGTMIANNAARDATDRLAALEGRLDEESRAVLQAAIEGLQNLTAAVTAAGAAVGQLLSDEVPDWSALAKGLATNSGATTQAVEKLCVRLEQHDARLEQCNRERDELLGEFDGDIQKLRYWISAAYHTRRLMARIDGADEQEYALRLTPAQA